MSMSMTDRAVIAGVGEAEPTPAGSGRTSEEMTLTAIARACAHAGCGTADIDAVLKYSHDTAMSLMAVAANLGCDELRIGLEVPYGGGTAGALLDLAKTLVTAGAASTVVCYRTVVGHDWVDQMNRPDPVRPHYLDTVNYLRPVGWTGYLHAFAAMYWEHAARHGTSREALGNVARQLRRNATMNSNAACRDELSLAEYMQAGPEIGPFGPFDDFVPGDVGAAVVITSAARARELRGERAVAEIVATAQSHQDAPMAWFDTPSGHLGAPMAWFDTRFLSPGARSTVANVAEQLYSSTGYSPKDIDVAHLYDCSTFTFLGVLEDAGLCAPGEGAEIAAEDHSFGPYGARPANTNGGDLAGGYGHGFRHVVEAARQVCGTAENQVPDAEVALVMGAQVGPTSGAIVRRLELA